MAQIVNERMTHRYEGELVVFVLGMRINKPWHVRALLRTFNAMPRMLAELSRDPDSGLLGYRVVLGAGGPAVIQYWDSHEKLYAYASTTNASHRPAWAAFNKAARRAKGAVGIWHETFQVSHAESIYVQMPISGLARATESTPVVSRFDQAKQRYAAGRLAA